MATSAVGNPYVESSDLVANYPATSLALATRLDKYALNPFADAAARDTAIPSPVQGQLAQTLDDNKAWKYDGSAWAPFSGAAGAANFTDTATGTYTDGGIDYKYITYSVTSSINIDVAGFATVLLVGGGGAGGERYGGGGGAGGMIEIANAYFDVSSHVVTVGVGGTNATARASGVTTPGSNGSASGVGDYWVPGGGGGGNGILDPSGTFWWGNNGMNGGSGGGASGYGGAGAGSIPGTGVLTLGFAGGGQGVSEGGGGGGSSAVGFDGTNSPNVGGNGGAGGASSITGSSVTYAGGGGGFGSPTAGSGGAGGGGAGAVTGAGTQGTDGLGGGGGGATNAVPGFGGTGIVIVRVVV